MNPTEGQLADLSAGEAVRLSPHHFGGQCPLYLTASQIKKVKAAHQANKGCTLKLSKAQIAFCHKNGSGLVKDLFKGGIKVVTPYAAEFAKKGVGKLVEMASDKAQDLIGDGVQQGSGWLGNIGRWVGHTAVDGVATALGGSVKPKRTARKNPLPPQMEGAGWLGSIGKWVGHKAVDGIADAMGGSIVQQQIQMPGAQSQVMAALTQKKVKRGKGLYQ